MGLRVTECAHPNLSLARQLWLLPPSQRGEGCYPWRTGLSARRVRHVLRDGTLGTHRRVLTLNRYCEVQGEGGSIPDVVAPLWSDACGVLFTAM
jgi:hypothetical protein